MQVLDNDTKFAHLGKPGTAFSAGFARRLEIVKKHVDLDNKQILDLGCGKGVWLNQFSKLAGPKNVFGSDIDADLISEIPAEVADPNNLKICPAESLDFADNSFDVVFTNEVLEHVVDDRKAVEEIVRVLKPGGKFICFTPNRGWPFEQHGIFIGEKYVWGNIPLLPWLPKWFHNKFAHHVRNYSNKDIRKLFSDLPAKVILHTYVFPGFDGLVRKFGIIGKAVQKFFHSLEATALARFGISHFVILQKDSKVD